MVRKSKLSKKLKRELYEEEDDSVCDTSDSEEESESDEAEDLRPSWPIYSMEMPRYLRMVQEESGAAQHNAEGKGSEGKTSDKTQASGKEKARVFAELGAYTDGYYLHYPKEKDLVYFSDVLPDLKCGKCECFLKTPVQVPTCGHKFCKSCILRVVPKVMGFCPTCKIKFDKKLIGPVIGYDAVIQLVRGQQWCVNALCYDRIKECYRKDPEGCTFVGHREHELSEHADMCGFKVVRCSLGCRILLWRKDVEAHADVCKLECPQQPCKMLVSAKLMAHHKKVECIATIVNCSMLKAGCTEKAQRKDMQAHLDKCPFALKAEIERLKQEKQEEIIEKEKWKQLCAQAATLTPVKKEVNEPLQKRLRSADQAQ